MPSICKHAGCKKRATYGYIINNTNNFSSSKRLYCNLHKLNDMINLNNKCCIIKNCEITANYGFINKKRLYCFMHKLDNMIHLSNKICFKKNLSNKEKIIKV